MPKKKKKKQKDILPVEESDKKKETNTLNEKIGEISANLYYISETDADILPFNGTLSEGVSAEEILRQTESDPDAPVEERDFDEFFAHLAKIQDWFEEEETENANRFADLKILLEENLTDLRVFKVGRIELDIYAVGLDKEGVLRGIKTKAVET